MYKRLLYESGMFKRRSCDFVLCHCLRTNNGLKFRVLMCRVFTTLSMLKTVNWCEFQTCFVNMMCVLCWFSGK